MRPALGRERIQARGVCTRAHVPTVTRRNALVTVSFLPSYARLWTLANVCRLTGVSVSPPRAERCTPHLQREQDSACALDGCRLLCAADSALKGVVGQRETKKRSPCCTCHLVTANTNYCSGYAFHLRKQKGMYYIMIRECLSCLGSVSAIGTASNCRRAYPSATALKASKFLVLPRGPRIVKRRRGPGGPRATCHAIQSPLPIGGGE